MVKIYTRTGDKGETGLWGGGRIPKSDIRIHAYGTVDELNAVLGVVRTYKPDEVLDGMLLRIQNLLFVVGADLATPHNENPAIERIGPEAVRELEEWIDRLEEKLPPLKQFIIQGGAPEAAFLHLARTFARRAERWAVELLKNDDTHHHAIVYLNRLSDFLFVAARTANLNRGTKDIPWDNPRFKKKQ